MNVMLTKDIEFDSLTDEKLVSIKMGTIVYFDLDQGIGYFVGNHFWLDKSEFTIICH